MREVPYDHPSTFASSTGRKKSLFESAKNLKFKKIQDITQVTLRIQAVDTRMECIRERVQHNAVIIISVN
jgi:hypothetical protein